MSIVPVRTSRPPSHRTSTTAHPSMSSSVGQSMPMSRTSCRLRRMYSWFSFSKLRSRLLPARRRESGGHRRSSPARAPRCRRTWPEFARSARECGVRKSGYDAHRGQRQKGEQRQPRADRDHERQRACGVDDGVGRIHDRRTQQHADRFRSLVARAMMSPVRLRW